MKKKALVMFVLLLPVLALARAVQVLDLGTLISRSTLVFVGRVKTVAPSGIKTTMSYPTWKGTTFEWLNCDIEVVEPIKGVRKGQVIRTAMLSAPNGGPGFCPPGMVDPKEGKGYLLCLAPTTLSNTFAAITAPWDDDEAIFVLDRSFRLYSWYWKRRHSGTLVPDQYDTRYDAVWNLVDEDGTIVPEGAESIRKSYRDKVRSAPPTNLVIHLQWETFTSPSGWQWDVPKGYTNKTGAAGRPVTMPAGRQNE